MTLVEAENRLRDVMAQCEVPPKDQDQFLRDVRVCALGEGSLRDVLEAGQRMNALIDRYPMLKET